MRCRTTNGLQTGRRGCLPTGIPVFMSKTRAMRSSSRSILEPIILCAILLLAAWLRFHRLDQAEFLWDQAEISRWALNMARQAKITWIGPWSSTQLDTFPGAIWLLAIPYAISTSPVFATGFVAAINLLTVVGCYFLVRRWFGRVAAIVATTLFAVAPWAVIYSRKIWHTELLPPFVLLYVVAGWFAFVRGRRWALLAHCLALAALVQLHFTALAFMPLTILWALIFRKRFEWRVLLVGTLLALLTFVPYFIVDAGKDWKNVQRFTELMKQPSTVDADAAYATWVITTGLDLDLLTGPDRYPDFVSATPNIRWLFFALGGLTVVAGVIALWRAVRQARTGLDDETAAALMATTWLLMPALFLTRHNTYVAPHYFTVTFPAQFILIGWLAALTWRWVGRRTQVAQGALIVLVAVLAIAQTYEVISVLRFVMSHDTRWGYGTPIAYEIRAVETVTRLGEEMGGAEVILLSEGDEPRMYEMPAAADILMYDKPHRSVDIRTALVVPAGPAVYWTTFDMTLGEELLATLSPELVEERIPLREGDRSFRFYRWSGGEPALPSVTLLGDGPVTWANGAQLVGYVLSGDPKPGGMIRWTLVWRATDSPSDDVYYHWFNHLLDEHGQFQGQRDGPSVLPAYWRSGDIILNWFEIPIAPDALVGDYTMRVGMYVYPEMKNLPVVDEKGRQLPAEWVEIGPIAVGQ
jgi:4-amino-4-deoxy-L-arabinose transferase-like glycosyltransferase